MHAALQLQIPGRPEWHNDPPVPKEMQNLEDFKSLWGRVAGLTKADVSANPDLSHLCLHIAQSINIKH